MEGDEEQYRLMNEEDNFYMGNKEDNREDDDKKTSNVGCAGMLLFMLFSGGAFICLVMGLLALGTLFSLNFLAE